MPKVAELHANKTRYRIDADAERSLLSFLRVDPDLMGSKHGCGESQCGACTVVNNPGEVGG